MSDQSKNSPADSRARHKNRTYLHLPFAYRVRRKNFYRFVATGVALIALTALLPWGIYLFTIDSDIPREPPVPPPSSSKPYASGRPATEPASTPATSITEAESESPAVSLEGVLAKYRSATGLQDIRSLLLHGSYLEDGRDFELKLAVKAPDLVSKTLSDKDLKIVCRYDGEQAMIEVTGGPDGQTLAQPLEDAVYPKAILLESAFLALADFGVSSTAPKYVLQADQKYEGASCWTITSQLPGGPEIQHLIDQESGFELARYINSAIDGTPYKISILLSEFSRHEGLHMPHAYTLKINGIVSGQARIDSIQPNSGLMPWMF